MLNYGGDNKDRVIVGNDGGVAKSTDGGKTWKNLNEEGLYITQFFGLGDSEMNADVILGGTQDNSVYVTNSSKDYFMNRSGGDAGECVVDPKDPTFMISVNWGLSKSMDYSNNSGKDWPEDPPPFSYSEPLDSVSTAKRPMMIHPENNNLYIGYSNVYKALNHKNPSDPNYKQLSNFVQDGHLNESKEMLVMKVAPSDTNVIYAALGDPDWDYSSADSMLFKSSDNGQTWTNISHSLSEFSSRHITDIEIDPNNPDNFWITFSGFGSGNDNAPLFFAYKENGTYKYENFSDGLPDVPLMTIEYQNGTSNGLYVGTDVGVYYRDASMEEWQCYNNDLPVTIVTDLEINHCAGKLRASTFGRGIWQADLVHDNMQDKVIDNNTTWSESRTLRQHLRIKSGDTLTVTDTLFMPNEGEINVEEGASLIVDGGVIKNQCGRMWQGIYVWGNSDKSQLGPSIPDLYDGQSPYHGQVILTNGATIANAVNGVSTSKLTADGSDYDWDHTGGGIIKATDARFINNRRSVEFLSFHNPPMYMSSGAIANNEPNNISEFKDCQFLITDDPGLKLGSDTTKAYFRKSMVSLWDVKGVDFTACEFINKVPEAFPKESNIDLTRGTGISSLDASFKVDEEIGLVDYSAESTVFKNLTRGVVWEGTGGITPVSTIANSSM